MLTAAVPESTEDVLLKGFAALGMEDERIETAQQFFSWFAQVQTQMDQDDGAKYRQMRDYLSGFQEQCDAILDDVNSALQHLESLQKQYLFVSTKTGTLHEACEQLLKEQSELVDLAENIQQKLSYFNELENINTKLNSPTLSVNSEGFIPMLAKLDDCIAYISSHPNFKDYPVYLNKFKQCLSKAMHLIKTYTVNTLQNLTSQLMKRDPSAVPNSDNAFTLFYVKFRAAAPKVRTLIEQVEQRSEKMPEYQQVLNEIHQCYLDQRELLLGPSIASTVTELTSQNNRDHCALVRSGCAFMVHVCQDEHQLYNEFFTKPTPKLDELLEKLCLSLYDVLRPMIIHVIHLETLSELCGILKNEMLEDHVQNNAEQLGAFAAGVKQMLEDVQERLVYRTHIYIQTDIIGYKPAPGDLAYPDKLEMMEQIAQSLKEEQKKLPSEASFSDVRLEDPESCSLIKSARPSDMRGQCFKDYRKRPYLPASSRYWELLIPSAKTRSESVTQVDGQLFLIKHLLILREQIAPFHTDFTIKEISLDLKKTRDAAFKILNPKAVSRFFRLNSNNALIQFLLEGTPEIREHYIDSKKDVDRHLKSACEQFIQQQTKQFIEQLEEFMTKVTALKTMATQGGPNYSLSQQPWAQPGQVELQVMGEGMCMHFHRVKKCHGTKERRTDSSDQLKSGVKLAQSTLDDARQLLGYQASLEAAYSSSSLFKFSTVRAELESDDPVPRVELHEVDAHGVVFYLYEKRMCVLVPVIFQVLPQSIWTYSDPKFAQIFAGSFAKPGMDEEPTASLWAKIKGGAGTSDIVVGIYYRLPDQED
ncbi:component of oligomeric golgi complex 3 [Pitangus sulphuratus]|nr:component of oligomeric golgi complex 3 [Pitangus sulphuratus]